MTGMGEVAARKILRFAQNDGTFNCRFRELSHSDVKFKTKNIDCLINYKQFCSGLCIGTMRVCVIRDLIACSGC